MKDHTHASQSDQKTGNLDAREEELSDQELDQVSGGITPIPIPGLDLSRYLQKPQSLALNPNINPKGFEGGGGIG